MTTSEAERSAMRRALTKSVSVAQSNMVARIFVNQGMLEKSFGSGK